MFPTQRSIKVLNNTDILKINNTHRDTCNTHLNSNEKRLEEKNVELMPNTTTSNKAKYRYNNFTSPASAEKENHQNSMLMEHMDSKAETLKVGI